MFRLFNFLLITLFTNTIFANNVAVTGNEILQKQEYDPIIILWLVIFIVFSRLLSIVKKIGLPLVVGEILSGIIIGILGDLGIKTFQNIEHSIIIKFLAELGAIFLMFEIGLESKFSDLKKNFKKGFSVAIVGTILTGGIGYLISAYIIPNPTLGRNLLFIVIIAATATGISARTFKDMQIISTKEVKIVLVASIIDELISIFCFGIISAMLIDTVFNLMSLTVSLLQVLAFFIFAISFGHYITPFLTRWSIKIHAGINMKIGVLLFCCFSLSWIAHVSGLASVIGAFIAGLVLDEIYFVSYSKSNFFIKLREIKDKINDNNIEQELNEIITHQESKNLEELIKPLSHLFVPVFFIYIGIMLNIRELFNIQTLFITITILLLSFMGRIISGYCINNPQLNKVLIGLGMTPVGEAGLIFAIFGKNYGIISDNVLVSIVSVLVLSAIITPIFIKLAIKYKGVNRI
jgi:Kef-type K+ transport system membrane component KefB